MSDSFDLNETCKKSFDLQVSLLAKLKEKATNKEWLSIGVEVRGHPVRNLLKAKSFCDVSMLHPGQREEIEIEIASIEKLLREQGFEMPNTAKVDGI